MCTCKYLKSLGTHNIAINTLRNISQSCHHLDTIIDKLQCKPIGTGPM